MNLLELIPKRDQNILVQAWDAETATWKVHPDPAALLTKLHQRQIRFRGLLPFVETRTVRGLALSSGTRVVVRHASRHWPNYAAGGGAFRFSVRGANPADVRVGWVSEEDPSVDAPLCASVDLRVDGELREVRVPRAPAGDMDLVVAVPAQKDVKVFFGIHRLLDRKVLYERCKGVGVEVGPGARPQILPGSWVDVRYVEQATPDQWQQLYGKEAKVPVDPQLWKRYVVGNADVIPAEEGTLDFVFSSHVVEHLANPLGHLAYWARLLRTGGVVAAIIPDMRGCKDYVFEPSTVEELEAEYRDGGMTPTLEHYRRWCQHRLPQRDPAEVQSAGRSIHVHFYTPESFRAALEPNFRQLGFRKMAVTSEMNHKDFFVLLEK